MRTSTLSVSHNIRIQAPVNQSEKRNYQYKPKMAQFYNKEDILRNKVERRGIPSAKILLGAIESRKHSSSQKYYDFFNTQVNPEL
jgi:hypothetical protein